MDTSSQNKINPEMHWHYETVPRRTKKAFDFLSQQEWLKKSKWYLAGGTDWKKVKRFFTKEIPIIADRLINRI